MKTDFIIFIILNSIWLLEWIVYKDTAPKRKEANNQALVVKSFTLLMFTSSVVFSFWLSTVISETNGFAEKSGLVLMAIGLLLRGWTYFFSREFFTRTIVPQEDRPLFSRGPYRFNRHPFHTGFFLAALGTTLFISSHWLSLVYTFLLIGSALHYRMSIEEFYYKKRYGDIYPYWCKHRFRLLPFLY
ncbi:methyltransferase family protein [Evansella halocellulosilytica]|uniref:methyltransferase family protein n=1 Tax=Evansella halocellulosilytica TaxID=2011013 RepID=UPI000BB91F58|nr:isoprenylcysteine carboxylmethyltransferase family protein [Evansella halocellulosilytica]